MADHDVTLWFNEHRWNALETALQSMGSNIEEHLTDQLMSLYTWMVPYEAQQRAESLIADEEAAMEAEREASRRYAVFHIKEQGLEDYLCVAVQQGFPALRVGSIMRDKLHSTDVELHSLAEMIRDAKQISATEFADHVAARLDGAVAITDVYDIDWDADRFSAITASGDWKTFRIPDVCAAAYHAERKTTALRDEQIRRFQERIADKAVLMDDAPLGGSRRLHPEDIQFSEDVVQDDDRLNFYLAVPDAVDEILGTQLCDPDADEWLNIYANYDMEHGRLCDTLEIYHSGPGSEKGYQYYLSTSEREMLIPKMEEHLQWKWGKNLEQCRAEYLAEEQAADVQEKPSHEMGMGQMM